MSKIELDIGEYFKNADAILPTMLLIDAIIQCGNDELIVDLSKFTYLDLENIKHLICLFHLNNPNKTVKFVETVKFEDMKVNNDNATREN